MLRPTSKLPEKMSRKPHKNTPCLVDIREFERQGLDYAEITYDGATPKQAVTRMRDCLKRNADKFGHLAAVQRSGKAYLVRKELL